MEWSFLEQARVALYTFEFIFGIVVFGRSGAVCRSVSHACSAVIALAVIAWIGLLVMALLHAIGVRAGKVVPYHLECLAFCGLSVLWLIVAVLASVLNIRGIDLGFYVLTNFLTLAAVFSWFNLFLHIGSAVIPFLQFRMQNETQMEAENVESGEVESGEVDSNPADPAVVSDAKKPAAPVAASATDTETAKTT